MKKTFGLLAFVVICLMTASCGILGLGTKNSSASASGQASGEALKSLYTQYKTDGQIDVTNLSNIIMLAQLTNGIQGLKDVDDKSAFYSDFAQGLIMGSDHLVTKSTANTVTNTLQSLANSADLSLISAAGVVALAETGKETAQAAQETVKETVQETTSQVQAAAQNTVSEAVEMIEDASDEVSGTLSSLTSIFGLFSK